MEILVFRELSVASILQRVLLSLLIGGVIGVERGSKNQPAGFRTYMLVCLGASLVMMTNQYICSTIGGEPTRLGAQVISGIGFLGAGTILVTRNNQVRGLTTAAGLWSAACIGIAIGIGFYEGAILVGISIVLIMTIFQKIDLYLRNYSRFLHLYLNFASGKAMNTFIEYCNGQNIKVIDMQMSKSKGNAKNELVVFLTIKTSQKCNHGEIIHKLAFLDGLRYIEEI